MTILHKFFIVVFMSFETDNTKFKNSSGVLHHDHVIMYKILFTTFTSDLGSEEIILNLSYHKNF